MLAFHLRSFGGHVLFSTTAEHTFNSLTSSVSVVVLPKVYLKVPFLHLLLFLSYINNLASSLTEYAVIALLADDVSFFTTACKREDAESAAQSVVKSVCDWNKQSEC